MCRIGKCFIIHPKVFIIYSGNTEVVSNVSVKHKVKLSAEREDVERGTESSRREKE